MNINTQAPFPIGTIVMNFGAVAMVVAFHEGRGPLLREAGKTGCRWYADPAKCVEVFPRSRQIMAAWASLEPDCYGGASAFLLKLDAVARQN